LPDDVLLSAESAGLPDDVLFPAESAGLPDDVLFPAESAGWSVEFTPPSSVTPRSSDTASGPLHPGLSPHAALAVVARGRSARIRDCGAGAGA
jgi:hypothetical protein